MVSGSSLSPGVIPTSFRRAFFTFMFDVSLLYRGFDYRCFGCLLMSRCAMGEGGVGWVVKYIAYMNPCMLGLQQMGTYPLKRTTPSNFTSIILIGTGNEKFGVTSGTRIVVYSSEWGRGES